MNTEQRVESATRRMEIEYQRRRLAFVKAHGRLPSTLEDLRLTYEVSGDWLRGRQ